MQKDDEKAKKIKEKTMERFNDVNKELKNKKYGGKKLQKKNRKEER